MAMPDSLHESEIWKAFSAARENAQQQLFQLQKQFQDQAELLSDWLGTSAQGAEQRLAELVENGAAAIPPGLRQDVIDAYSNLARVYVEAADELKPYLDFPGTQEARLALTEKASQIMTSGGLAAGGAAAATGVGAAAAGGAAAATGEGAAAAGLSTLPAWLIPALIGLVAVLGAGGLWMLTHRGGQALLGTWHTDVCGYSDVMVLNLNLDEEGKLAGTIAIKDFIEPVGAPPCTMTQWDGTVDQSPLIEPHLSGKVLTFSTTFGGLGANMRMVLDGNKLIWQSDQRYVLTKR
jgi:hypothetical protein